MASDKESASGFSRKNFAPNPDRAATVLLLLVAGPATTTVSGAKGMAYSKRLVTLAPDSERLRLVTMRNSLLGNKACKTEKALCPALPKPTMAILDGKEILQYF
jgi:hypothetical protein